MIDAGQTIEGFPNGPGIVKRILGQGKKDAILLQRNNPKSRSASVHDGKLLPSFDAFDDFRHRCSKLFGIDCFLHLAPPLKLLQTAINQL